MKWSSLDGNKLRGEAKRGFLSYICLHHLLQKENGPFSVQAEMLTQSHWCQGMHFTALKTADRSAEYILIFSRMYLVYILLVVSNKALKTGSVLILSPFLIFD